MITPKVLLEALAARLKADAGVRVTLEPDPMDYGYEPVLRLNPADWEFDQAMSPGLVTLKVQAVLEASGDSAGVFLDDATGAHLSVVLWLNPADFEDPVLVVDGRRVVVTGEALGGPALQRNDEEGKKAFLYQKTFDLGLSLELSALRS